MKVNFDADYIAGYVVLAAIGVLTIGLLFWAAWNDIGHWQNLRVWTSLGAILILGPAWVLKRWTKGKGDD